MRRQARDDLRFSFYDIGIGARLALRQHLLYQLDGPLQLLVRRSLIAMLCSTLCSRGISKVRHRKYIPGGSRRTFAMAFSPCRANGRK